MKLKPGDKVRIKLGIGDGWDGQYRKLRDMRAILTISSFVDDWGGRYLKLAECPARWLEDELDLVEPVPAIESWTLTI